LQQIAKLRAEMPALVTKAARDAQKGAAALYGAVVDGPLLTSTTTKKWAVSCGFHSMSVAGSA
jgi:hypothetical protein